MQFIIKRIHAIDTLGKYPIAFVEYEGCSPKWEQYQNDQDIQNYIATHNDYAVNVPHWKY